MKTLIFICLAFLMLISCGNSSGVATISAEETVILIPTAAPTSAPDNAGKPDQVFTEESAPRFEINVWLADSIAADPTTRAGSILAQQMAEFDTTHPDVDMVITSKKIAEQGGTLSYLRSGRTVAPDILPDLVILPGDQLATAVDEGLIFPLDDLIDTDGFYPSGLEIGRINGQQYGVPFAITGLYHAVYDEGDLGGSLPDRWDSMVAIENGRVAIAAAGYDGAAIAMQLYANESGNLTDSETNFIFEGAPLAAGLSQLKLASDADRIVDFSADLTTQEAVWEQLERRAVNIAFVNASNVLERRASGNRNAFAALPGRNGEMPAVVSGYVWAIATPDVARQAISAELIHWLINPQNLGTWSASANMLPARPVAFAQWENNPYTTFLQSQLQQASAMPNRLDTISLNALTEGVVSILQGDADPAITAGQIIDTPRP